MHLEMKWKLSGGWLNPQVILGISYFILFLKRDLHEFECLACFRSRWNCSTKSCCQVSYFYQTKYIPSNYVYLEHSITLCNYDLCIYYSMHFSFSFSVMMNIVWPLTFMLSITMQPQPRLWRKLITTMCNNFMLQMAWLTSIIGRHYQNYYR